MAARKTASPKVAATRAPRPARTKPSGQDTTTAPAHLDMGARTSPVRPPESASSKPPVDEALETRMRAVASKRGFKEWRAQYE